MYRFVKYIGFFLSVLSLIISINFAGNAQVPQDSPTVTSPSPKACLVPPSLKTQQVIADNGIQEVKMGDRIRVRVEGLSAATKNVTDNSNPFDPRKLVLYLDGYEIKEIHGEPVIVMVQDKDKRRIIDENWLAFRLDRTDASEAAWNALLGGKPKKSIDVIVGVGCPNHAIPFSDPQAPPQLRIVLFSWRFLLSLLLLLGIVLLFFRFCRDALRSSGWEGICYVEEEGKGDKNPIKLIKEEVKVEPINCENRLLQFFMGSQSSNKNPFSLSIFQLALWTFIIFGSYLLIYGITGDYTNILTGQSLILLGINAVTAFGTSLMDGQGDESRKKGTRRISEGFFKDVLSDINGVNFHRFQTFIWTVAIGLFFVWEVGKNLAMPEFDETLLTLQGISAATFLGLRGQERHGMRTKPNQPASPGNNSSEKEQPPLEEGAP
jgi:hypothetical protein